MSCQKILKSEICNSSHIVNDIFYQFLILAPNKNNLFIYHSNTREGENFFVVVESRSILYSSKIFYLQVGWFTGYSEILIQHW